MRAKVITDSGTGLSKHKANELGLDFLPLQVIVDDKVYLDGVDLNIDTLYDTLEEGNMPQTSLPPLGEIEDLLESYNEEGISDIVLITLSNGLSSTNTTVQAAAKRHDINVHTLDLFTTLAVENYCALKAQELLEHGKDPKEIVALLKEAIENSSGYLIPNDLDHLAKGGRLTPMAAKLGGLLKIKPILEVSKNTEGKVGVYEKVRTQNKAIKKAVEKIAEDVPIGEDYVFFTVNSRNEEGAKLAEAELKEKFGANIDIRHHPMFAVIASHTGMGAVGIQYIKKVQE
ncbi:DegV family protein [Dubosiella newyorkensis]|uniref:EDD domain protein n=3 Tax=Dubosiella newyorkensis TaxID=1862672 RepID=A0A1U7NMY4_9FIRM|nr:DegV family protein [Dubosiella newyorkensis]OLU46656.1 EDD domain protein [Dubosiella newyorkensis]